MESLKIYTAITHDLTEGHAVRYVQLPLGLEEARAYFTSHLETAPTLGKSPKSLIALIPGQHIVGLTDTNTRPRHPEKMIF